MVMTRTDTMSGYNHIELDEIHSPSRYFASAFICVSLGGPLCFLRFGFCFLLRSKSMFFIFVERNAPPGTSVRRATGQTGNEKLDSKDILCGPFFKDP